ncbi:MAG: hypothetical protein Fur0037_13960 [Planctomycetota bacterium]
MLFLLSLWLTACGGFEEKRIRELMHEKGFGTRADGDATRENYVAGGDVILFTMSPQTYMQPEHERLFELVLKPQTVSIDGTIQIPYVGAVPVLGKTEAELQDLVRALLKPVFKTEIDIQARISSTGKVFYAFGETGIRGVVPLLPDLTVFEAMARVRWTDLANLGRVYLIRPDAETPLVMTVNVREMITTGYMASNFRIKEHDILYVPPTFLGLVARVLERLMRPVGLAVSALFGIARAQQAYDFVTGKYDFLPYYRF